MIKRISKKVMALVMTLAMVLSLMPVFSITAAAATPTDEGYDDNNPGFEGTPAGFTLDGIKYTLTRAEYAGVINQGPSGGSVLGNDGTDYYMCIAPVDSVKLEAADGSSFKLNGFAMDFLVTEEGDGHGYITITPSTGTSLKYYSGGIPVVETVNLSSNTDFWNITSVTISGPDLLLALDDLDFEPAVPSVAITSATYNAVTGDLVVTGAGITAGDTIDPTKLSLTGEGGNTYTLTSANVNAISANTFSVTLNATDKAAVNQILNKDGSSSTGATTYNLTAADDWDSTVTGGDTSDATNAVTVSNVAAPTITSATYDASTGVLTVTGTGFLKRAGAANDIVVSTLTLTGDGTAYTLTTADVEITSGAAFTVTLNATDKAAVNLRLNKNGTSSTGAVTYNLASAEDWASGADASMTISDLTGNGITVSGVNAVLVVSNLNGDSVTYIEGSSAVLLDSESNATVTYSDSVDLNGGNVTASIITHRVSSEDVLSIKNVGTGAGQIGVSGANVTYGGTIIGTFSGGTGTNNLVVTLNANATPMAVTSLIRALTYSNTNSADPSTAARTVSVTVNDGSGGTSANADVSVSITATNDAPTILTQATISVTEGSTAAFTPSASDTEGSGITWSITGGEDAAKFSIVSGVVTFLTAPSFSTPTDTDTNNQYILVITASDGTRNASKTVTVTVTQQVSGGGTTTPPSTGVEVNGQKQDAGTSSTTSTVVEVNGQKQDAGTSSTTTTGGQTVTTITVDSVKLDKILGGIGEKPTVTLPSTGSDVTVGELNGQTIKNMEAKEATLEIKTDTVTYTLPASQINIDSVSSQIGSQVELKDIKVSVKISQPSADTVRVVEDTANKNSYQLVVKPVEFEISCTSGDKTVAVSKFNGYVERTLSIPDGVAPSKITTGIVLNADGSFRHVPTQIVLINSKYYAKINSLTNSTYSVIYNPVEFSDVATHWAKTAINDMGSRMVVTGDGTGKYNPDVAITRAEFAAIAVRAMGLQQGTTESGFADVSLSDWFNGYVGTAKGYGLINGYDAKSYGPNDTITREQAMTILTKAMKVTGLSVSLTDSEVSTLLASYTDGAAVSDYAKASVSACLKTGIVTGTTLSTISPKDYVTRAEVVVMVQRLLQKSGLI